MRHHLISLLAFSLFLLLATMQNGIAQNLKKEQTLLIASSPQGAKVFINDREVGVTPYQINLIRGDYNIRISHPDYFDFNEIIDIVEGDDMQVLNVQLKIKPAQLTIKTADDVDVKIDHKWVSKGPYQTNIDPGRHTVTFGGELYAEVEQIVRLRPGEKKMISFVPERQFGELEIITRPSGAQVRLNGKEIGASPILLPEVRIGKNIVEVSKPGYVYERRNVIVENIRTTVVKIKMTKIKVAEENNLEELEPDNEIEDVITPLSEEEQEKRNKRYEIRNPFSWKYHDLALNYIRGISGNGAEIAYLNKMGAYVVYTMSPGGSYQTYGGGILIREHVFGRRNRGGFFMFGGAGSEFKLPGYYWEVGQLVNLGRVAMSFGVSQVNFKTFLNNSSSDEYLPYNDLKVRFGIGVSF